VAQVVQPDGWEAGLVDEAVEAFGDGVGVPWAAVRLDVDQAGAGPLTNCHRARRARWLRVIAVVVWSRVMVRLPASDLTFLVGLREEHRGPAFVTVLLAELQVNTCWQLAEQAGHGCPDAMQRCCTGRPRPRSAS
jgi:hypothetical protein